MYKNSTIFSNTIIVLLFSTAKHRTMKGFIRIFFKNPQSNPKCKFENQSINLKIKV